MDFTLPTEATDAAELAATILAKETDPWSALGDAGLLSLTTPEAHGGAGLGLVELCAVLVEVGRVASAAPVAADSVARLLVAELGTDEQQEIFFGSTPVEHPLAWAISEPLDRTPITPATTATPVDGGYAITGTKVLVPMAAELLVTATLAGQEGAGRVGVFAIGTGMDGVTVSEQRLSTGEVVGLVELDGVEAESLRRVDSPDGLAGQRLVQLATVATCAVQLGVTEGALRLTAEYAKTREQFDRPIGTFQAVAQRLADGYIDTRFQALTVWQAAWRLAEGRPAADAVATAKLWAADAGHALAHTTVHVHGGVGIDLDGDAHRYFTAAKRLEMELGGATESALAHGRLLATGS